MVTGGLVKIDGVEWYRIDGVEEMEPFLMTVVSDTDLWMFVSSIGALTAGRIDADHALFPYETDDRLHRNAGITGPVTVIARTIEGRRELWRPFHAELTPGCSRSIAKSVLGDRLIFEEHHRSWGLRFRATWAPSDLHGWVRTTELTDLGGRGAELEVLDGLLDMMPAGVDAHTEQTLSNLVDSYKRCEAGPPGRLAVFTLEALITDRPEPAESLTATVVWSTGFASAELDLDERGVAAMVAGRSSQPRRLLTGRRGSYLLRGPVTLPSSGAVSWSLVADTDRAHPDVLAASEVAVEADVVERLSSDLEAGSARLRSLLQDADACQSTADGIADAHHFSNVLFNTMRGGVFPYGHQVPVADFAEFLEVRNSDVSERHRSWTQSLASSVDATVLRDAALATGDADLIRLVLEYLPLTFSRRHGDPSRPWNRFSIKVRDEQGDELLSYEGNWRDIFQNWEALLASYPAYFSHVVAKFVNATTLDGYNPYRISREGIDWEVPDPDDPWSHIGYWGDHQIVYLLRLLEAWEDHEPGAIRNWLDRPVFAYADVPYLIADHEQIVADPRNTITYDEARAELIAERERQIGSDGRLVVDAEGELLRVGLAEKLLVPALGKLTNFVPDGGIWINTQRPEWNDANNALAGPGLSMVTLYHLYRYLRFLDARLAELDGDAVALTSSVAEWFGDILVVFEAMSAERGSLDDCARRAMLDALGAAGEGHRHRVVGAPDGGMRDVRIGELRRLCTLAGDQLGQAIGRARRVDGLYDSYNRISFPTTEAAQVDHLGPMLEGQVAVLSSGALGSIDALALIEALFESSMYRTDQNTFMLYPVVELPAFLDRNQVPRRAAGLMERVGDATGLDTVFVSDDSGRLWFRPEIINAAALGEHLAGTTLSEVDRAEVAEIYEDVFGHSSFTGRSGSMYGYEGIGSVYWHMVAKLLLAVQECYWAAIDDGAPGDVVERLANAYRRVRSGLGFKKTPAEYGAVPTDCYSHTPGHAGARQPGMTGQVKEELLTRFGELGIRVQRGRVTLSPGLLPIDEFVPSGSGHDGTSRASFTYCSVPMTIGSGDADEVTITDHTGAATTRAGLELTASESHEIFARSGAVAHVAWTVAAPAS